MAGRYSVDRPSQARPGHDDGVSLPMSILIVDSAPHDLGLKTMLSGEQGWKVVMAQSGAEALRTLAMGGVDLVLTDLMMPESSGLELCRSVKNCPDASDTPVVILLNAAERGYLGQVYEAGACDYLMKPVDPVEVIARVRAVLRTKDEIDRRRARERHLETRNRELLAVNEELLQLSLVDPVTGVANRRQFNEMIDRAWRSGARHQFEIGLILMDIDFFKGYNDRLGHPAGDDCLRRVANELAAGLLRPDDFMARYGGEEFAVILPRTDLAGAEVVAERLRSNVESLGILHPASPAAGYVTISQGLACAVPGPESAPSLLIALADEALYEAKHNGRNQLCSRSPSKSSCPVLRQPNPITGHGVC
jgi:diguanylate cyclase (GGDEF)-like protein